MLIWQQERKDLNLADDYRQSFYDIGCGNGLLVYLLSSEGYPGKGIDIRARKIWTFYPPEVKLEVSYSLQFILKWLCNTETFKIRLEL